MKNTETAFNWIIDIFDRNKIKYRISGGFAARIYGVERELADIDIEVENVGINKILEEVKPYIIFGPSDYKDNSWDLYLMTLKYEGQEIDIAGSNAKIFNQITKEWEFCSGDLKNNEIREVYGRLVLVEPKDSLINYKRKLGRDVDLEDIRQLQVLDG